MIQASLRERHPDAVLMTVAVGLGLCGVVLSGSARVYHEAMHSVTPTGMLTSLAHLCLGLLAMALALIPDYRRLGRPQTVWMLLVGITLLLIAVLLAPAVGGTHRWIRIAGFSLQPSELAKPILVVAVAAALVRAGETITSWQGLLRPLIVGGYLCLLVLLGRDLGTPTVMFATTLALTIVAGARWKQAGLLLGGSSLLFTLFAYVEPYRWKRLIDFTAALDPTADNLSLVPYQLRQALIAVGSGGVFGRGLGMSTQKAFFLPEAEDDFVFAVICEELGMLGALAVLLSFLLIAWRGVRIAEQSSDDLGRLIALGASWLLCGQALIHAAVVTGLLPTKGLPLPFLSAGGSSLIASCTLAGLVLNVSLRGRRQ